MKQPFIFVLLALFLVFSQAGRTQAAELSDLFPPQYASVTSPPKDTAVNFPEKLSIPGIKTPFPMVQQEEKLAAAKVTDTALSNFEEYTGTKGPALGQYGYSLFSDSPTTFAPVEDLPVGPDYVLGPGDQLKISIWGRISADFTAQIERDGRISIPQLGVLQLAGLTFSEAKAFLDQELARYYKPSEVKMNISMGALRTIRVFVVGKARRPGTYKLSSFSTLVSALFATGGPSKVGSMRDIQLRRNGKVIARFDMYDFLLKGDKSKDQRLMPEDVIYIPPVGRLAGIAGGVREPSIYELRDENNVKDLIDLAGGLNDTAFKNRLQIDRILDGERVVVLESNPAERSPENIQILPGDIVTVFSVFDDRKTVRISGAVHSEGEYGIGSGLKVSELIKMAGGLKYFAYTEKAEITRLTVTPRGPTTEKIEIELSRALDKDPGHDIALQPNDYIFVRSVPEWELFKTVTVTGEVKFPGVYTVKKGETISSLIERAGGYTENAYVKGAAFTRKSVRELQQIQLDEAISRLEQELMETTVVSIETSLSPEDAKMRESIAAQKKALIARMRAAKAKGRVSISLVSLEKFRNTPSDLALEDGDTLHIPEKPSQVQVMGAVYNQTASVYSPALTLSNYIDKAGGITESGNYDRIYVLKMDGTAVTRKSERNSGWFGSFMSSKLDPGDTIVVPEKLEKISWMKEVKDITQILYQIAVTAGVLIVAF